MAPADTPANKSTPPPAETLEEMNRLWTIAKAYSTTAHDVNNALQVISGSAELLATRPDLDPVVLRRVEAVRAQASKAASVIERLLMYSRGSTGTAAKIDLAVLAETAVSMRACSLGRLQITTTVSRSDDQPYMVMAEPPKLLQVLLDLLLTCEGLFTGQKSGVIAIQVERRASAIAVVIRASAPTPLESLGVQISADSEPGGPLWAAARLVSGQAGSLVVEDRAGQAVATLEIKSL